MIYRYKALVIGDLLSSYSQSTGVRFASYSYSMGVCDIVHWGIVLFGIFAQFVFGITTEC